jgi:hypothetical protein
MDLWAKRAEESTFSQLRHVSSFQEGLAGLVKDVKRLIDSFMASCCADIGLLRSLLVQLASPFSVEPAVYETRRMVEMLAPLVEDMRERQVRLHDPACRDRYMTMRIAQRG